MARLGRDALGGRRRRKAGSGKAASAVGVVGCTDGGGGTSPLLEQARPGAPGGSAQVEANPPLELPAQDGSANAFGEFDPDMSLDLDLGLIDPDLDKFLLDLWPDPSNPVDFFSPMFGESGLE